MQQVQVLADRVNVQGTELYAADGVMRQTCYSTEYSA